MEHRYCGCGKELISDEDERLGVCGDCRWSVNFVSMNGSLELKILSHALNAREDLIIILK